MKRFRFFPFLLIVLVHLALLQWISTAQIKRPDHINIYPVVLTATPVITQFKSTPPKITSKVVHQKKNPPSKIKIKPIFSASKSISSLTISDAPPNVAVPDNPEPVAELPIPSTQQIIAVSTRPPPSARYLLDVVRTEPGVANPYYGSGEMHWRHDNAHYTMQIEVGVDVLFNTIQLYHLQSEGTLDEHGIKPRILTETRRRRSATTTYFWYESKTISFSENTALTPLSEGAQDKATVLMQLASIGNADPSQFQPGKEFTIQVAEEKEATLFQFVVIDQESIDTKLGHLTTWHLVRPPRPGFYSSRLDIWFAPDLNWLPVQIRNTEANGAITTQTIRKIIQDNED